MKKQKEAQTPDALRDAINLLRKQYGDGVVIQETDEVHKVESFPTGSFAIDNILGCGGLPKGRIIEIYGQESSGKSTLCLFLAAQIQKQGGTVAYLDAENAYDRSYSESIGVDTTKLLVSQPNTLEENFDIIRAYAATNAVDLCIVDSVAALTPKSELEGEELLKDTMAIQARLMGKALRILTGPISRSKMTVIFVNQLRDKIGVFYGEKTVTPGGKALKFFASVRLNVAKGEKLTGKGDEQIGTVLKITATKNKVAPPWRSGSVNLYFGSGIDLVVDAFDAAVDRKVIKKDGNTYTFGETKLGVGRDSSVEFLRENTKVYEEIRENVTEVIKNEK